ncbi:cellulose binding domain-containing protein [Halomonas ventosae]|uniref:Cellulose binding domain-containing protein n=1 Tax=Halomonas ventosae TaxID=229007 RepID=A0A4R6ZVH6_9GAMM|nr:cellulose binding domain-containing protein [Halomonas ventosae]TDR56249.1 cellulose binding domain-containing protein [Halomonas ventosae]
MASIHDIDTGTSAEEINDLIRDAEPGSTLKFAAGNHLLDDALRVERSDIALVGAGSGDTTLTFSDRALERNDDHAIHLDGFRTRFQGRLEAGLDEGDRRLSLDRDHGLAPGDTVRLWQDNDDAFFDAIGDTSWRRVEYAELRTSMARVESVEGNDVVLDRGAHFAFEAGETRLARLDSVDDVRLEGFSVAFELGEPDAGLFTNTREALSGYDAVLLEGTVGTQLADLEVRDGPSTAFRFSKTLDPEAEGITAHGAFNKGSGGNGYAYELHESYDGTFTGLEDSGMRHGLTFASWRSSVGNDIEVAFTDRDINFHGGQDHDNRVRVEQSIRDPETDDLSPSLWINQGGESFGAITDAEANEVIFDYLIGSRRSDKIEGSDDGVYLNGGSGHDSLTGGAGNDILQGGPGNDWYDGTDLLDGGAGVDTARYADDYDDHQVLKGEEESVILGQGSQDTLVDMEFAVFGDGTTLHLASGNAFHGEPLERPEPDAVLEGDGLLPGVVDEGTELLVTGNTTSSWSSGYVAELFVQNLSDEEIVDPRVRFDLPAEIDTLWNGRVESSDDGYSVRDDDPGTLEPGEAWRFAFKAYGDDPSLPDTLQAEANGNGLQVQLLGIGESPVEEVVG